MPGCHHPRNAVERVADGIVDGVALLHQLSRTGVQAHTHAQRSQLVPIGAAQRLLRRDPRR